MFRSAMTALLALLATPLLAAPDLVVVNASVRTSEAARPAATGFAVANGKFVYVGNAATARALAGPSTKIVDMQGAQVLPGLVDAHVHPLGIVDVDQCDLNSEAKPLADIARIVRDCIEKYKPAPGEWLSVAQWNFSNGNQTDADHPTLRAALDKAAPDNPVKLLGNDGHHGGFNSAGLKLATADGKQIGLSRETLAGPFARYRQLVAVDSQGEPSGGVNEDARALMSGKAIDITDMAAVMKAPEKIMERLNSSGITTFLDAAADPETFVVYDTLQQRGQLTAHTSLAQYYDPGVILKKDGTPDYDRMVNDAVKWRNHYAKNPLIRADTVKLFADGVQEGNPLVVPPTLPNSPSLKPYHQPVFGRNANGSASFDGRYVDTASAVCVKARQSNWDKESDVQAFMTQHGYHPAQCRIESGKLQHPRAVQIEWVRRMHKAGMSLHIHAIGDAAVRTAVDALEAARKGERGKPMRPDTLAHLQLVSPTDQLRIGRTKLFLAMTYAWIYTDKEYDLTVVPFIDKVKGDTTEALHPKDGYYERNAYPVGAMKRAGAVLVAGSDAPVETRDPRPFVNMAIAISRARGGTPPLGNASQRVTAADMLRAYTIDGARALGRDRETGSIAVGKSADFIVVNRDILNSDAAAIAETQVLATWFQGREVWKH